MTIDRFPWTGTLVPANVGRPGEIYIPAGAEQAWSNSGFVNVLAYGAKGDGTTDDGAAINAAVIAANAMPTGGVVYVPAGTFRVNATNGYIVARSNVTMRGAGVGKTVIVLDDTFTATSGCVCNQIADGSYPTITNFQIDGITFQGKRVSGIPSLGTNIPVYTAKSFLVSLNNANNIVIQNCEFLDSTSFSLLVAAGDNVTVRNNRVMRSTGDSIAIWNVSNALVTGNRIIMSGDDSISMHANDSTAAPLRSGIIVTENIITDSPGIKILGAKVVTVSNNIMRRCWGIGIWLAYDTFYLQGNTPAFSVQVTGNTVMDHFTNIGWNPYAATSVAIRVDGSSKQAGSGASAPGTPVVGTGVVTPLYGSTTGTFYAPAQYNTQGGYSTPARTVPSPGGALIRVEGNTIGRSLPAVSAWSQWGYGTALEVGVFGSYTGAITATMMRTSGIYIVGAMRNARIAGNMIQTGGTGISFDANAVAGDYDGLEIVGNRIADFANAPAQAAAIFWPTGSDSPQRIRIEGNDFDGDPLFEATGRAAGGTWTTGGAALYLAYVSGVEILRNHFRNVFIPVTAAGASKQILLGNVVHCDPVAAGYNAGNRGVGTVPAAGPSYSHIIETSDPASATYGQMRQVTTPSATAMPATGTWVIGQVVVNETVSVANVYGWQRLTTGSNNVLNTDWRVLAC